MKYSVALLSLLWFLPVRALGDFDSSCFREVAELDVVPGLSAAQVENIDDDIFFVGSDGKILPARLDTTEKNPPLRYTTKDTIDTRALDDSDPYTAIEIDPMIFLKGSVSYTFDLGKVYTRGKISPKIGYVSDREVSVSLSTDGDAFVPVAIGYLEDFDMRFLRITFSGSSLQNGITRFHTLNFFQKIQTRYSFSSSSGGQVVLYRSYACQREKYRDLLSQRPSLPYTKDLPGNTYSVAFHANTSYQDDTDGDGVENLRDNCPNISNNNQNDKNHDGIGDACADDDGDNRFGEKDNCPTVPNFDQTDKNVNGIGDACEFDSDGDGISDSIDNAIHSKNPDQKDNDNDGIGDVMDNCTLFNPDQLDLNKNSRGDVCDRDEEYRKTNDEDHDGVLDYGDNCRKISNSKQDDADADGIGDVCDNCKMLKNPDQSDINKNSVGDSCEDGDNDTFIGWRDNCPDIANIDQKDSDNNGIGDACSDIDGDTFYDALDTCPTIYNQNQNDIDKDGIGDACDTSDDRLLESNKYIFMSLIALLGLVFIGGIIFLILKIQ